MVNFTMRAVEVESEGSGEGGDHWSGDGSASFIAAGLYQHPSVAGDADEYHAHEDSASAPRTARDNP
jgi:hypothetical protein